MGRIRAAAIGVPLAMLGLAVLTAPVSAADGIELAATIDGRDLADVDSNEPLALSDGEVTFHVEVVNESDETLEVRSVRLDGRVLGLTFFSFTTRVDLDVEPGERGEREFLVDLAELDGQATGLIPARLTLLDRERLALQTLSFPVDVDGSLRSVYGVFGIAIGLFTVFLIIRALALLATRRLAENRVRRALAFLTPGVAVGLTLTFSLSVFGVLVPNGTLWVIFVGAGALVGFLLGYLAPGPATDDDDEIDSEPYPKAPETDVTTREDLTTTMQRSAPLPPPP